MLKANDRVDIALTHVLGLLKVLPRNSSAHEYLRTIYNVFRDEPEDTTVRFVFDQEEVDMINNELCRIGMIHMQEIGEEDA